MTQELYSQIGEITPDNLIAGTDDIRVKGVIVASGQGTLARGSVLGLITKTIGTPVPDEGNTGNGTITGIALKSKAEIGNYILECIEKGYVAADAGVGAANAGNTGNGTVTAAPATGNGCKIGTYKITCIQEGTDTGKFQVEDPTGIVIGTATVGAEFVTHIIFTITDGSTDFVVGDGFTVVVAAESVGNDGVFTIKTPSGYILSNNANVGAAFVSEHINLTINDGSTDFAVGDKITLPIAEGSGKAKLVNSVNVDGTQFADCILTDDVNTTDADVTAQAYMTGLFNSNALTFGGNDTAADHEATLRTKGIFLKENIAY